MGMIFSDTDNDLILLRCNPGTALARLPKWRENLQHARLREIDGNPVLTKEDVNKYITQARLDKKLSIKCTFSTEKIVSMNPQEGVPQIHYYQMNVITASRLAAQTGEEYYQEVETVPPSISPHILRTAVPGLNDKRRPYSWEAKVEEKLTRSKLKQQTDWDDWLESEYLQLDQYETQDMFSTPRNLPHNEKFNVLPMIWNYLIKNTGRKRHDTLLMALLV